jgi:hypothetical protein
MGSQCAGAGAGGESATATRRASTRLASPRHARSHIQTPKWRALQPEEAVAKLLLFAGSHLIAVQLPLFAPLLQKILPRKIRDS